MVQKMGRVGRKGDEKSLFIFVAEKKAKASGRYLLKSQIERENLMIKLKFTIFIRQALLTDMYLS